MPPGEISGRCLSFFLRLLRRIYRLVNLAPQIGQVKSCLPESIEVELRNTRHALGPYASPRVGVDDYWSSRPCRKWYSDVYRMHLWGVEKASSAGSDRFASSVGFTPWGFCREVFIEKSRFVPKRPRAARRGFRT